MFLTALHKEDTFKNAVIVFFKSLSLMEMDDYQRNKVGLSDLKNGE
jgi:hypothetical protein